MGQGGPHCPRQGKAKEVKEEKATVSSGAGETEAGKQLKAA